MIFIISLMMSFIGVINKEVRLDTDSSCYSCSLREVLINNNNDHIYVWTDVINSKVKFFAKIIYFIGNPSKTFDLDFVINDNERIGLIYFNSNEKNVFNIITWKFSSVTEKLYTFNAGSFKVSENGIILDKTKNFAEKSTSSKSQQDPLIISLSNNEIAIILNTIKFMSKTEITLTIYDSNLELKNKSYLVNSGDYDCQIWVCNYDFNGSKGISIVYNRQREGSFDYFLISFDLLTYNFINNAVKIGENISVKSINHIANDDLILSYSIYPSNNLNGKKLKIDASKIYDEFIMTEIQNTYNSVIVSDESFYCISYSDEKGNLILNKYDYNAKLIDKVHINSVDPLTYIELFIRKNDKKLISFFTNRFKEPDEFYRGKSIYFKIMNFDLKPIDPEFLSCKDIEVSAEFNSKTEIQLTNNNQIKISTIPIYGFIVNSEKRVIKENDIIDPKIQLYYKNNEKASKDSFSFNIKKDENEGENCFFNIKLIESQLECKNLNSSTNKNKDYSINFVDLVVDKSKETIFKNVFLDFDLNCGAIYANNINVIKNTSYDINSMFRFEPENCMFKDKVQLIFKAENNRGLFTPNCNITIDILKPTPKTSNIILYGDANKDIKINLRKYISDEYTDYNDLKLYFANNPTLCGGKIWNESGEMVLENQKVKILESIIYKKSNCDKEFDQFAYFVFNNEDYKSDSRNIKITFKHSPKVKNFGFSLYENQVEKIPFTPDFIEEIDSPFAALKVIFIKLPKIGTVMGKNIDKVEENKEYSINEEFSYVCNVQSEINFTDIVSFSILNTYGLMSNIGMINFDVVVAQKWWKNPLTIIGISLSGLAALASFIYTIFKCKKNGYCCFEKKTEPLLNLNIPDTQNLSQLNVHQVNENNDKTDLLNYEYENEVS